MPVYTASNSSDIIGSQVVTGGLAVGQSTEVNSGLTVASGGITLSAGTLFAPDIKTTGSSNALVFTDLLSAPSAPGADLFALYSRGGSLYYKAGASGAETLVGSGGGGGGGGATLTISSTLTGGSYNGSSPVTIGLNLSNANTWSATQTFSSSLIISSSPPNYATLYLRGSLGNNRITMRNSSAADMQVMTLFGGHDLYLGDVNKINSSYSVVLRSATHIYYDANYQHKFSVNNNEYFSIAYDGSTVIGGGDSTTTPTGSMLRGPDAFFGTDLTGGNLSIGAGSGTGSASGGYISFHTSTGSVSGSTTNSLVERIRITPSGYLGINTTNPGSSLDVKGTIRISGSSSGFVGFSAPSSAGSTTYVFPSADGIIGQVLTTNGNGGLFWSTPSGGGGSGPFSGSYLTLSGIYGGTQTIQSPSYSSVNTIYTLPVSDGLNGQVLSTNGSGQLSWTSNDVSTNLLNLANTWNQTQTFSNIVVQGSMSVVSSLVTTIENPTISLGAISGGNAPVVNDGYDKGIEIQWFSSSAKKGFLGIKNTTNILQFIPDATFSNGNYTGALGAAEFLSTTTTTTTSSQFRIAGSTSGYVSLSAPPIAGSSTFVLPSNTGTTGQVLSTDGNGTLSWLTVSPSSNLLSSANSWANPQSFTDIVASGSLTVVSTLVTAIQNPTISLGEGVSGSPPSINDGQDRGIEFQWYDSSAKKGFFGYRRSTQRFSFIPNATVSSGAYSGTLGDAEFAKIYSGSINATGNFNAATASVYTSTALGDSHFCVMTYNSITITLPSATGIPGRMIIIKKMDATSTTVMIATQNGQYIDGNSSLILSSQYAVARLISSGTSWVII